MVSSWPKNTKKETAEKTTDRTMRTCTAWSHTKEIKRKTFLKTYYNSQIFSQSWDGFGSIHLFLPVSLVDVHNQVPVELSSLQLYQRSDSFDSSHTHQVFERRSDNKKKKEYWFWFHWWVLSVEREHLIFILTNVPLRLWQPSGRFNTTCWLH